MILSDRFTILTNDPDNFRIRYAYLEETNWNEQYPQLFIKSFEETLKSYTDLSITLSQFSLEIFENKNIQKDLFSESLVYHTEASFIKLHGYLYTESNKMIGQANAHYYLKTL